MNIPRAILLDIEGTLVHQGQALPGAVEVLAHIRRRGLALRLLTNITARLPERIAGELAALGLAVRPEEIQTAATACAAHLQGLRRERPSLRCALLLPAAVRTLFAGIPDNRAQPDIIVLADLEEAFTYGLLNQIFRWMREGAQLLALQKNPFWFAADGPRLDCGAFVAALESATGHKALVAGKPSPLFFQEALRAVGCTAGEVLVVGDDLTTDLAGAAAVGAPAVLVGTGKYRPGQEEGLAPPQAFLPDLTALPALLTK